MKEQQHVNTVRWRLLDFITTDSSMVDIDDHSFEFQISEEQVDQMHPLGDLNKTFSEKAKEYLAFFNQCRTTEQRWWFSKNAPESFLLLSKLAESVHTQWVLDN